MKRTLPNPSNAPATSLIVEALISSTAIGSGGAVLFSRVFNLPINDTLTAANNMVANTAFGFILAGLGLLSLNAQVGLRQPKIRLVGRIFAGSVTVLGVLTLIEYLFDFNLGIDEFLIPEEHETLNTVPPRMSPMTAFNFTLLGLLLILRQWQPHCEQPLCEVVAVAILGISGLALLGYVFSSQALYHLSLYTSMALLTACLFALLSLGLMLTTPHLRRMALGYGLTLLAVILAFKFNLMVGDLLDAKLPPFVTFYSVILLSGLFAGLGPSLFALILSALTATIWSFEPIGLAIIKSPINKMGMVLFIANGLLINGILLFYRRSRQRVIVYEREQAVRGIEEQLALAVSGTGIGLFEWEIASGLTYWTEQHYRLLGLTPRNVKGSTTRKNFYHDWADRVHPDDLSRVEAIIRRSVAEKSPYEAEYRVIWPDGSLHWLMGRGHIIADPHGRSQWMRGMIMDITRRKLGEDALNRLASIVESSNDAILSKALDGRITTWNTGAERLFGYTEAEIINQSIRRLIPPERQMEEDDILASLKAGEEIKQYETVRITKDGRRLDVSLTISPIKDKANNIIGASKIIHNISESKLAEKQLRESEEKLRLFIEYAPAGIAMFDRDMHYIAVSRRWCSDYGLVGEEVIGRSHYELWPEISEQWRAVHRRGLAGEVITAEEDAFVRVDGSTQWLKWEVRPWHQADGTIGGILIGSEEITVRKRTETRLKRFYESGMLGAIFWDKSGEISDANDKFLSMFGYSRDDLIAGRINWRNMTPPEYLHLDNEALFELKTTGISKPFEKVYLKKDGTPVPIMIAGALLDDASNEGIAFILDITERKQIEAALIDAGQRKDEFLAMLGHELRNPLTPIMTMAQLLDERSFDSAMRKKAADIILRNAAQLCHLVDDLLDVSRVTHGQIKLQLTSIDLLVVLREALEIVHSLIQSKQQTLHLHLPEKPIYVNADQIRLNQIFSNLLVNAAKFTAEGGLINVTVELAPPFVSVFIRDNGIGISADLLPFIFDLFTQGKRSMARSEGGLGIGLTLVKRLVELHDGQVSAMSQGIDQGTEFVVKLPLLIKAEHAGPEYQQIPTEKNDQPLRVLLIDDNENLIECSTLSFEMMGHQVETALNGTEGLAAALSYKPDVIVVDIGLPDMDGYQVAKLLREQADTRTMLIIAMSGYAPDLDSPRMKAAQFDHYLIKPPNVVKLQSLLADYQLIKRRESL